MTLVDVLIIIGLLIGVYQGYKSGALKYIVDLIILFISMVISSFLSPLISNFLYRYLPFFNLISDAKGLKAINIIIYRVLIYIVIMLVFVKIFKTILRKLNLEEKIMDSVVASNLLGRIIGSVLGLPFAFLVLHSVLLVAYIPLANIDNESNFAERIIYNVPLVSKNNRNVYDSELEVKELLSSDLNNEDGFTELNEEILNVLINNEIIKEENAEILQEKDKLTGDKKDLNSLLDELFKDNDSDEVDEEYYEEDEEYFEEDEEYYEE